jgi:hypothetical protein
MAKLQGPPVVRALTTLVLNQGTLTDTERNALNEITAQTIDNATEWHKAMTAYPAITPHASWRGSSPDTILVLYPNINGHGLNTYRNFLNTYVGMNSRSICHENGLELSFQSLLSLEFARGGMFDAIQQIIKSAKLFTVVYHKYLEGAAIRQSIIENDTVRLRKDIIHILYELPFDEVAVAVRHERGYRILITQRGGCLWSIFKRYKDQVEGGTRAIDLIPDGVVFENATESSCVISVFKNDGEAVTTQDPPYMTRLMTALNTYNTYTGASVPKACSPMDILRIANILAVNGTMRDHTHSPIGEHNAFLTTDAIKFLAQSHGIIFDGPELRINHSTETTYGALLAPIVWKFKEKGPELNQIHPDDYYMAQLIEEQFDEVVKNSVIHTNAGRSAELWIEHPWLNLDEEDTCLVKKKLKQCVFNLPYHGMENARAPTYDSLIYVDTYTIHFCCQT